MHLWCLLQQSSKLETWPKKPLLKDSRWCYWNVAGTWKANWYWIRDQTTSNPSFCDCLELRHWHCDLWWTQFDLWCDEAVWSWSLTSESCMWLLAETWTKKPTEPCCVVLPDKESNCWESRWTWKIHSKTASLDFSASEWHGILSDWLTWFEPITINRD